MTDSQGKIQTSWFLLFPEASGNPSAENLARAARYTFGWIWNQTEILAPGPPYEPPQDWSPITDISDAIKALNLDTKVGLYCGSGMFSRPYEPGYTFIDDADLFHKPDGTDLIYTVNDVNHRFPNLKRPEVRDRLASDYAAFAEAHDFDGLLWDSWSTPAMAFWISQPEVSGGFFELPGGILEGAAQTEAFWEDVFTPYTLGVKEALEADGRKLYVNGLGFDPAPPASTYMGVHTTNVVDYATGALNEVAYRCYGNATLFAQTIEMMRLATASSRGEVYFVAQPALLATTDPSVVFTLGDDLMWFYLATFLLVDVGTQTFFGYWPNTAYIGLQAGAPYVNYEDAWDLRYGKSVGRHVDGGTTRLYWRRFTEGVAVVNPTASALTFREPGAYRVRHPESGQVVNIGPEASSWYAMPPYTGTFLFNRRQEEAA